MSADSMKRAEEKELAAQLSVLFYFYEQIHFSDIKMFVFCD
ncbi:hypothetical protein SD77_3961 [Bacillus badius]|uniref:Uncharacterized protein n=1 Tax=Bacillus badius TaxID=1455 RepID=A0ABR5AU57_BACBA|nr:hypothetical protein SD77_3961 [Bacillus badius]